MAAYSDLDPTIFDEIERICDLSVGEVTPADIGFLKARFSYLTGDQVKKFESFLMKEKTVEPKKVMSKKK